MWILRRKGGITAKKIAEILECRASKSRLPRFKNFIVNYGHDYENANLNKNVVANKLKAYIIMKDAGVSQPRMFRKGEQIPSDAFPLLARKQYHTQGRDIIFINNQEQLDNDVDDGSYDFLTEYIHKTSEYRVHILGDEAFVSVKFNDNDCGDPFVRSHSNGWRQIEYNREWKDKLIELARKAIKALKYDFGAVDIIRKNDNIYVLEVNSSPGLEPRKLELYAQYFKKEEQKWRENERTSWR